MKKEVQQQDTTEVSLFAQLFLILKGYDQKKEVGKNRGAWVDPINSWMGVEMGEPYCLSGILYCLKTLEESTGARFDLPKLPSTQRFWAAVRPEFKELEAKSWSIGIMQSKKDPTKGHAVMVLSNPDSAGYIETFEFNTDISGSRDGDGAFFTKRSILGTENLKFLGFIPLNKAIYK